MKTIAMIPARYDSSRFEGKMLADLCGKPVIARTYDAAVATGLFDQVYVVTDHDGIEQAVKANGGQVLRSHKHHETGSDRIAEAVEGIDCDIVVNVQGDEPFVTREPLEKLIEVFSGPDAQRIDLASMVQELKQPELIADPNYVKVVMDHRNFAMYLSRSPIPYLRDKDSGARYYEHVGVYAFRRQSLLDFARNAPRQNERAEKIECIRYLEYGLRIKMVEAPFVSLEVDTPQDLEAACALFRKLHG
ncbi:MAG TPA: 3-deoxy-manno-octulosonate cytidylyltransferase [Candidatus Merdimorpha stercoravium]|uniref:3-deoxy-manno-octulosonate cytidylyltransferase n=1 Tax=Candidatus Merdimorpha stercoravium TaxID=2840863 RepID=A0A9D1HA97_9FLAO|nr:3-deoxy-manno-octulosonate cytidylyltransferase [Candidatus Merdimorpha stercoravium]